MMKKADASPLETLEALIAEKRRQETFLAKLEERRAGTPEHVFNRLRDEYLTKLTDAQVKAAAAAESLSEGLADDDAALADVEARLGSLEEERIEMQLRAEVEEWDPKETSRKLAAMTAAISLAEKERDAHKAVAERTRGLLAEARGDVPVPDATTPAGRPITATITGGPSFDELAFLRSVVGRASTPAMPAPAPAGTLPSPTAGLTEPAASNPEAVVLAPQSEPASAPVAVPPAPAPAPAPANAAASVQSALPLESSASGTPAARSTGASDTEGLGVVSGLGRPTPRTTQQIKTLKCAECGSMNYPTEWYCERCGGELAAL